MTAQRSPEEILRAWGRSASRQDVSEQNSERRDRAVARIAQNITLAAEQRRRVVRFRARVAVLCAVAAAFAIVWAARSTMWRNDAAGLAPASPVAAGELRGARNVTVERGAVQRPAAEAMPLAAGDVVRTQAEARTRVVLVGGAQAALEPESRLVLGRGADTLELLAGEVSVSVPRLVPPLAFVVRTPDARIVVHGTRFVVTVLDAKAVPRTRVRVLEGRVGVEYQGVAADLLIGQSWPAAAQAVTAPGAASPASEAMVAPPAPAPPARRADPKTAAPGPSAASTKAAAPVSAAALAEQNRLFSAAVAASRRGNDSRAIALIDELLARHPASPLLPEARVERFRALKRLGQSSEAAREASRYLLENENGAARDEAREVVLPDSK